jgi:hypothetical protein
MRSEATSTLNAQHSTLMRPTDESPESRFWQWFAANSDRLQRFQEDQEQLFDELGTELNRVHAGLTFEFGPVEEGRRHFVVSADGIRDRFPAVERLVAAAPDLPGWNILPFRQRVGTELTIQYGDIELGAEDIWFTAEPQGDRVNLTLYVRGLPPKFPPGRRKMHQGAAFILLDAALGEYDTEMKVGGIDWKPLPKDPAAEGLRPFPELPEAVDRMVPGH